MKGTHEIRNDSVEFGAFETKSLGMGAEADEILTRPGNDVLPQLNRDSADRLTADGDIEIHLGQFRHGRSIWFGSV